MHVCYLAQSHICKCTSDSYMHVHMHARIGACMFRVRVMRVYMYVYACVRVCVCTRACLITHTVHVCFLLRLLAADRCTPDRLGKHHPDRPASAPHPRRIRRFLAHISCIRFRQRKTKDAGILVGPRALAHALATFATLPM